MRATAACTAPSGQTLSGHCWALTVPLLLLLLLLLQCCRYARYCHGQSGKFVTNHSPSGSDHTLVSSPDYRIASESTNSDI